MGELARCRGGPGADVVGDSAKSVVAALQMAQWRCWRTSGSTRARPARTRGAGRAGAVNWTNLVGADGAFVSDGFGVVHSKAGLSTALVAALLPHYEGTLVLDEVEVTAQAGNPKRARPRRITGGDKGVDKLGVIANLP